MLGRFSADSCVQLAGEVDPVRSKVEFDTAVCCAIVDCFLLNTFLDPFVLSSGIGCLSEGAVLTGALVSPNRAELGCGSVMDLVAGEGDCKLGLGRPVMCDRPGCGIV